MATLRSVNTRIWEDAWVESLNPSEKLLFIYLLTNRCTNLIGIYEITTSRMCFETGIDKRTLSKGLERFRMDRKAYFINDNYMFLPNWLKNQNLNANMKKGVLKLINALPTEVKVSLLGNDYLTIQKDYPSILNTLLKYEVLEVLEDEVLEVEVLESSKRKAFTPPTLDEVKAYCLVRKNNVDAIKWHNHYKSNGWKVGKNKMVDWKSAVITWERNSKQLNIIPPTAGSPAENGSYGGWEENK